MPNRSLPPPPPSPTLSTLAERDKLKALLSRVRGGRTLVLLGSREPENWLTGGTGPGIYPLPGLDPQAASTLVERILDRHYAARYLKNSAERSALQELVTLLGGYPLPLTVVLPVLATVPPSAILAELKAGGPGADPAGLIGRAIEYSHGKLDPALQHSLLLLAPFTSRCPRRSHPRPLPRLAPPDRGRAGARPDRPVRGPGSGGHGGPGSPASAARLPGPGPAGAAVLPAQPPPRPARPTSSHQPGALPALRGTSPDTGRHAPYSGQRTVGFWASPRTVDTSP